MNGRLATIISPGDFEALLGLKVNPMEMKRFYAEPQYNLSPSSFVPIITNLQQERVRFFKWGLIPSWSSSGKNTKGLISFESKAIQEKPVLLTAFRNKRCLVICSGFYLWKDSTAGKIPYFIKHKTQPYFFIGGVWENSEEEQDSALNSFSLITKKTIGGLGFFNQDIPFLVKESAMKAWMETQGEKVTDLFSESSVIPEREFEYYPVGRKVLKSLDNDPRFIQKVAYVVAEQTNLF
jgi:putative SOS response-associated peptidase YedK